MLGTINITTEYALLAMFYLSLRGESSEDKKKVVTVEEISREMGIPITFLAKIMIQLSKKKLVSSSRGRKGGYLLTREANSINLVDVIECFDQKKRCNQCFNGSGFCSVASTCPFFTLWQEIYESTQSILKKYSLNSLAVCIRNMPEEGMFLNNLKKHLNKDV